MIRHIVICLISLGLGFSATMAGVIIDWPNCAVVAGSMCNLSETKPQCYTCCDNHCSGADRIKCRAACDELVY